MSFLRDQSTGHFSETKQLDGACCFHMANGGSTVLHEVFELSEQLFHISSHWLKQLELACESLKLLTKVIYDDMRYSIEVFMAPWSGKHRKKRRPRIVFYIKKSNRIRCPLEIWMTFHWSWDGVSVRDFCCCESSAWLLRKEWTLLKVHWEAFRGPFEQKWQWKLSISG